MTSTMNPQVQRIYNISAYVMLTTALYTILMAHTGLFPLLIYKSYKNSSEMGTDLGLKLELMPRIIYESIKCSSGMLMIYINYYLRSMSFTTSGFL